MTRIACEPAEVRRVESVEEAVSELRSLGSDAELLAGGTWIMRAALRGESFRRVYVALDGVAALRGIELADGVVRINALTTHAQLAELGGPSALDGVRQAAGLSAFPAVRNVATVGGNLAARGFAEADLVPALLAAEAELELAGPDGRRTEPLESFLAGRDTSEGKVITRVIARAPAGRCSAFARLTVRGGGEYALASLAASVDLDDDGIVTRARVAIGSVEERSRLCPGAAAALEDRRLGTEAGEAVGEALQTECHPRNGPDAPAWYRREVLPVLSRRIVQQLLEA